MSDSPIPDRPFYDNGVHTVIPRQGRRVHTPFQGSILGGQNLVAISDLIPTAAIRLSWPLIGTTTYADTFGNQNEGNSDYDNFILQELRDEGYREGGWFTRGIFGPTITPVFPSPAAAIIKTTWRTEMMDWHPVLEGLFFIPDYTTTIAITNKDGTVAFKPRTRVQYSIRPGLRHATTIRRDWYVSTIPFNLKTWEAETPRPSSISWELEPLGQNGMIPECLHDDQECPGVTKARGLINAVARKIPRTSPITWVDYKLDFVLQPDEPPFYIGILETAIAPSLTPIEKITIE